MTDSESNEFLDRISTEFRELLGRAWSELERLATDDPKNRVDLDAKLKFNLSSAIPACGVNLSYGPKKTKLAVPVFGEDPDQCKLGV